MVVVQWLNQAAEVLEEQEDNGSVPWSGWVGYLGRQVVTHTHLAKKALVCAGWRPETWVWLETRRLGVGETGTGETGD